MKQSIILAISILAGLAAFGLTHRYLQAERAKIHAGAERVRIIAADADLPAGTVLRHEDLGGKTVYRTQVGTQAVLPDDVSKVIGKKLRFPIRRGDPLLWSFVDVPERMRSGLAPTIKPGMRAVSLGIGGEAAVSGLVQPDDRVDILGTFSFPSRANPAMMESVTLTVLQDVTVLATGQRMAKGDSFSAESRSFGYSAVTLEVTLREAELLVFAQHMRGQLTLALRHPEDVSFERDLPEVNFERLEKSLPELNLFRQREIRHKRDSL
ncbi:MAG: Flp pilus assembly protein CpaB [Kiritimatiellia bacterium]|nr:Flp pilus assembly protein CpaB [Kiritimatiellia bacterium]